MWFVSSRKTRVSQSARRRPSAFRPRLEALEDRCLLSAGALDPTFGNGAGYVTTQTSTNGYVAESVLIQPNGDIVASGQARTPSGGKDLATVRYNPDGSLDTSFGNQGSANPGIALANFGSGIIGTGTDEGYSALFPAGTANAGDIVQQGYYSPAYDTGYQALALYNSNGTLDTSFGNGGELLVSGPVGYGVVVTSTGQSL